jgi:hypothetical protein
MMRSLLLCLLPSLALADGQITLEGATDSLELITSAAGSIDYHVSYANVTATALTTPGTGNGNITTATTTTVLAAPAGSNWRHIRSAQFFNASTTVSNTVTIQVDRSAANRILCRATLAPGESIDLHSDGECQPYDSSGRPKTTPADPPGFSGRTYFWTKAATAIDTIGYHYLTNKDNGFPGAWSVGTPGVNGVVTACDVVGTAGTGGASSTGSPLLADPSSGGLYLTRFGTNGAVVNTYQLLDILWYNTGLVVTTTTAQAIVSPAFPARDVNGSANGEGLGIALYALTALGNAAAVGNSTVSYTNAQGTAGRTATFSAVVGFQAPATPVIGTWMPFNLQEGDTGVRSIQSITLTTTYTSGTMMLVVYRPIALDGVGLANGPSGSLVMRQGINPGVRIYNDTCFGVAVLGAPAVTAPSNTAGIIELMER